MREVGLDQVGPYWLCLVGGTSERAQPHNVWKTEKTEGSLKQFTPLYSFFSVPLLPSLL